MNMLGKQPQAEMGDLGNGLRGNVGIPMMVGVGLPPHARGIDQRKIFDTSRLTQVRMSEGPAKRVGD